MAWVTLKPLDSGYLKTKLRNDVRPHSWLKILDEVRFRFLFWNCDYKDGGYFGVNSGKNSQALAGVKKKETTRSELFKVKNE